jgi:osmotically-inducible protein OsmY
MKTKIASLCVAVCLGLPVAVVTLTTGCAGDRYNRSTGEYIDDKGLSMRVRSALGDNAEYKFSDVSVTSFKGTVQLSGFVNSSDQKAKAGTIAKNVEGVRNVENNITVKE